ncbi:hypothetical protein ACFRFH_18165 [Leifsonia sp. NPDC056824]|uniref:hypothetical protein n=1 Tax=Leifsonia sp. NPDC056824 TaxID=3345953 RepID=UPI00367D51D9
MAEGGYDHVEGVPEPSRRAPPWGRVASCRRRVSDSDGEAANRVFELLMGNDVAPRKEFIIAGADDLSRARIDA